MQRYNIQQIEDTLETTSLCPIGEPSCSFLPEVDRLRAEVDALLALANTDELTGLYNYRHFNHAMALEMERTRRSGKPMSLIMFDLDHFKLFNDRWGHEFGNTALVHIARLTVGTIRRLDIGCRYGGEEFAIILPDTPLRAGILLANRLREKIANSPLSPGGLDVSITASFGVDVYHPSSRDDVSQFLQRADAWLFEAKMQGRNRVCHPHVESESCVSMDERELLLKSE